VLKIHCPEALSVNTPFEYFALPVVDTTPTSRSYQPAGNVGFTGGTIESVIVAFFVSEPAAPVTVTGNVPMLALPLAVNVSVLVLPVFAGLNDAVTPLGSPEAVKLTLLLNPLCGVMVIVLVPLAACEILTLLGDAPSVNVPTGFTVRETVVVAVKEPDVPVIVTLLVPAVAVPLAVNVSVLVLPVLAGLNDAVTPLGSPEAVKLTLPLNPFRGITLIVLVPLPPCVMLTLLGEVERRKPGGGPPAGQLFTRFAAFIVPIPVAKSQPLVVPYAGLNAVLEVESTPTEPSAK